MHWALVAAWALAAQVSVTRAAPVCAASESSHTDTTGGFTAITSTIALPTTSGGETSGLEMTCFTFEYDRCGVDATSHVLGVSLLFYSGANQLLGGYGVPISFMQTSSLQKVRANVKATHFALQFRVAQAAGDDVPCTRNTIFKYKFDFKTDELAVGSGDAGDVNIPPMVVGSPGVFSVDADYSISFFKGTVDAPTGKFIAGTSCGTQAGSQLQRDPVLDLFLVSGKATGGGLFTACIQTDADGTETAVVQYLVVGGTDGILSKSECANGVCKVTIIDNTVDGSQVMLVSSGAICDPANAHTDTTTDLKAGTALEVDINLAANAGTDPDVCYKKDADANWIKTIGEAEVNAATFKRAQQVAEATAAAPTNGQNSGTTIGKLGFGLIAGGVAIVGIIAAAIAGVVYYRRRRKGYGVKLRALMLN